MNARIDRILELAEITGRKKDPWIRALLRRLSLRPDQRLEEMLLRKLTLAAGDQAFDPQPYRTPTEDELSSANTGAASTINWGSVMEFKGKDVVAGQRFDRPFFTGHGIATGGTRSGKSSAVAQTLRQIPSGTTCWVFDSENDPVYLSLACSFPPEDFYVFDLKDFKRNLMEPPPNCDAETWFGRVKRNLRESCFLRDGSLAMLAVLIDHCRRAHPDSTVTLREIHEKLLDLRYRLLKAGREYSFYESLRNRLEALLLNPMFDCVKGFDLTHLCAKHVLFRCAGLSSDEYPLFVNDLLSWLSCHFEPSLNPVPRLLVVIEELHRLTNPQRLRRADIAEPIILDAVRTLAKRRVGLFFVDQVPSELPVQVMANCGFRAVFNTIDGRDLDAVQRSLGLTHEQREFVSRLPQRQCVVQYANSRFPEPFPVVIDEAPIQSVPDEQLTQRLRQSLDKVAFVPVPGNGGAKAAASLERDAGPPLISKPALDYLSEIANNQFLPASKRDQDLGIPLSQGNALRKELKSAGVIVLEQVNTYSKARRILNTRITENGYSILKSLKVPFERPRGKGGWQHRYHQRQIATWGRAHGFEAEIECSPEGKAVDVSLVQGGKAIAVEILCEGVRKEMNNLRDLQSGFSEIWFCVKETKDGTHLKATISALFGAEARAVVSRVQFKLLAEFQEERHPNPQQELAL